MIIRHCEKKFDDAFPIVLQANTAEYGYDIANRLISKALPNGVTTTYEYDGMSRLKRLKDDGPGGTLFDNQYAYNPANQISQIAELAQTRNFSYDNVDRLTAMTNGTANESYAFDDVGNRTSSHLSTTYTHEPFNKLTATETAMFGYDPNGNMVWKSEGSKRFQFAWDAVGYARGYEPTKSEPKIHILKSKI